MKEDKMEERILAYLVGECDEEEAFEVEKMCRENALWQAEKIRFGQILGLLEESTNQPDPESLPEKETKLTENQRNEIKSLLAVKSLTLQKNEDENSKENKNEMKKNVMTEKEEKDEKNSKVIYWAPLAAAAVAAMIAYWGSPEKEAGGATVASTSTVEQKQSELNSSHIDEKTLSEKETFSAETEIALQDAIADSANETLALRTASEIKELEQANIENLPSGKELAAKITNRSLSIDKNNSLAQLEANVSEDSVSSDSSLAAAFSLPVPLPAPAGLQPEAISGEDSSKIKSKAETNFSKAIEKSTTESSNRWYSLIKGPQESFVFNEKGDSLGKIQILESTPGKIQFKRTNWPNQNRNFTLETGAYEIRLSQEQAGTLILKGNVIRLEEGNKYEFRITEAWELDKEEKRNPVPIEDLNP